jgi:hypothetical protein
MLIECTIRRANGSSVRFGEKVYTFGPGLGPHVAEVNDPEHIRRLLEVTSAFKAYRGAAPVLEPEPEIDPIEGPVSQPRITLLPEEPSVRRRGRPRVKPAGNG